MSFKGYTDKLCEVNVVTVTLWELAQTVVLLYNRILLSDQEKWLTDTGNDLDESRAKKT